MIRRKGAAGELPVPLGERIEILILLCQDSDESIRHSAFATLQSWNLQELCEVLAGPGTSPAVLEYVAIHLAHEHKELLEAMLKNPLLPDDIRAGARETLSNAAPAPAPGAPGTTSPAAPGTTSPAPPAGAPPAEEEGEHKKQTLLQRIGAMTPAEKIKTALTGNMEERLVLIRDSNKLVARAVLGSPKITDQEIENMASMKNVTEEVLRLIAMNRKFIKNYAVKRQLINNPRTPIDVGLPLLNHLNERDIKGLLLNKNIAETLRSMALKIIKQKEEAKKIKLPEH